MKNILKIAVPVFLFAAIFALLFYLRMIPAINNNVEFRLDGSFNYRMTKEVLANGDVPGIDRLSTYPDGKNIKQLLPTGLYHLSAFFYKLLNVFKKVPLNRSILLFCSLCGSLILIPLYFLSYEIYKSKTSAYLTAFLGGIMPAYLNRSSCYWYRHETVAVPVLFLSLLFFIKAFKASSGWKTFLYSIVCAASIIAALYIWRLSVLFLICYAITIVYIWIKRSEFPRGWLIIILTVFGMYLALVLFVPGFGYKNPASDYGTFPKAAVEILKHNLGSKEKFSDFTRLVYNNRELGGVRIRDMFGRLFLSFSGVFAVIYFFSYFRFKKQPIEKDILFLFLLFFFILTFTFSRNKGVLGPLVAITLGEAAAVVFKSKKQAVKNISLAIILVALIKTGYDAHRLAVTRYVNTKLGPQFKKALVAINKMTPERAVILCDWPNGYPIQTYCGRPTITDGLFESPEIVRRIIETSKAYYSTDEDQIWGLCKKYGAGYLLVSSNSKRACAGYAGAEYKKYYRKSGPTELGKATTLYMLISTPEQSKRFRLLFRNKQFLLYAVG